MAPYYNIYAFDDTIRWITLASLKGLAPYVGSNDQLPDRIILDELLTYNEQFPISGPDLSQVGLGPSFLRQSILQ